MMSKFTTRVVGARHSLQYRVYLEENGQLISPFHDIPLYVNKENGIVNMVCEIPKFTNAKCEIATGELMNPIKQDVKKGNLRFVRNVFPFHGYIWNYGCLPQTWESPKVIDSRTGLKGDNDPIDAIEIGQAVASVGQVKQVKVLGVLGLLDEGETDWKILVIDVNDPLAPQLNSVEDVESHCPGLLKASTEWFRIYKIPDGKEPNKFAFDGKFQSRDTALHIIEETHSQWKGLVSNQVPSKTDDYQLEVTNTKVDDSPYYQSQVNMRLCETLPENPVDDTVNRWTFIPASHL